MRAGDIPFHSTGTTLPGAGPPSLHQLPLQLPSSSERLENSPWNLPKKPKSLCFGCLAGKGLGTRLWLHGVFTQHAQSRVPSQILHFHVFPSCAAQAPRFVAPGMPGTGDHSPWVDSRKEESPSACRVIEVTPTRHQGQADQIFPSQLVRERKCFNPAVEYYPFCSSQLE